MMTSQTLRRAWTTAITLCLVSIAAAVGCSSNEDTPTERYFAELDRLDERFASEAGTLIDAAEASAESAETPIQTAQVMSQAYQDVAALLRQFSGDLGALAPPAQIKDENAELQRASEDAATALSYAFRGDLQARPGWSEFDEAEGKFLAALKRVVDSCNALETAAAAADAAVSLGCTEALRT
jgi:hypothetical protein